MEKVSTEQILKEYPYLEKIAKYTIFTTADDLKKLKNGEKIEIDGQEVSVEFLKRILKNDTYYEYASRFFNNEISIFCVGYVISGDVGGNVKYNKTWNVKKRR